MSVSAKSPAKTAFDQRFQPGAPEESPAVASTAPPSTQRNLGTAAPGRKGLAGGIAAAALALALGAAAGCSASNNACFRSCPALEGQWMVTFEPAADPPDCQQIGATVADGELDVTRQTSRLAATFAGLGYTGTAYDSGDFSLDAQGAPAGGGLDAISFRGTYTPGRDAGPVGDRLDGVYDALLRRPGPQGTVTCLMVRSYSAVRR